MINIQEYQIKQKEEEIYTELLKNGQNVTTYEVNKKVNDFFDHNTPGLPYFKPTKIEPYSKSDKAKYNDMFYRINEDLKIAFSIFNSQSEYSITSQSAYDLEMENIHNKIDLLMLHSEILENYSKKNISYYPKILTFSNLTDVNTRNLYKNNIPFTTSEIDFNTSTLRNELHSTPNDKIDISNAELKLSCSGFRATAGKDVRLITNDVDSDIVDITLKGNSEQNQAELFISVFLETPKEVSKIELTGYSLYNTSIKLLLSEDGDNFLEKSKMEGQSTNTWRFNKTKISALKICITKYKSDFEDEDDRYFYYILKNISLYNDKYSKTSVYVSNVIKFDNPISDITITPDHKKPPNTDIAYFVGTEDKNNDVEWKAIKPNVPLDIKLLAKEEMILNYFTSEIFGEQKFDRKLGEYCFYIHELPESTNLNSLDIRTGHSQWLIEKLDATEKTKDKKVLQSDYSKSKVTNIAPLDATIMEIRCEEAWNYFLMSQYVICENDTIIENRSIKFDVTNETFDYIVLINGKQIFSKNNKFAFKLKKGENIVQIMVLLGNLNISNLDSIKTIKHNFNLMAYSKEIYAGPKMQRVSYNSLSKNVSNHSLKYYSINTEDLKDKIIVKYDPNYILKPIDPTLKLVEDDIKMNNSEYFRVYLKFKNMPKNVKDNITNADKDSSIRCRIMAKLSTADISVSPYINSIKVVAE